MVRMRERYQKIFEMNSEQNTFVREGNTSQHERVLEEEEREPYKSQKGPAVFGGACVSTLDMQRSGRQDPELARTPLSASKNTDCYGTTTDLNDEGEAGKVVSTPPEARRSKSTLQHDRGIFGTCRGR